MAESPSDNNGSITASLLRFIGERLAPLSEAFAKTPLMQLRLISEDGNITLVKSAAAARGQSSAEQSASDHVHVGARSQHAAFVMDGEPGQSFETVNAEVVGIFHAAEDMPSPGEALEPDRLLGHVEALKLKNAVRSGAACAFVAQVVEDGQAVEFGETLFVVDRRKAAPPEQPETLALQEPPRL